MAEELTAPPPERSKPETGSSAPHANGMNLPNKLTVARLVLTVVFLALFFTQFRFGDTLALIVFAVASLTDYFDGKIARRDNLITNFGILMDPLADKILICSAFIAFVGRDLMP